MSVGTHCESWPVKTPHTRYFSTSFGVKNALTPSREEVDGRPRQGQGCRQSSSYWLCVDLGACLFVLSVVLFLSDLRVLGKGDFRQLIKWRLRLVAYRDELTKALEDGSGDDEEEEEEGPTVALTEEEKEDEVQAEIRALQ